MGKALECYEQAIQRPHGEEDEARCVYLICEQLVLAGRLDEYGLPPDALEGVGRPALLRERITAVDQVQFAGEM